MTPRPPMIRTDNSNPFANHTMRVRVPAIVREVAVLNPDYSPAIQQALAELADQMASDQPLPMLNLPAPDYDDWRALYAPHAGETWQNTDWFFAELFAYRHIIQAVRWWETGRDPFAPKKLKEYAGERPWQLLDQALAVESALDTCLAALLDFSLWGNRVDLSYAIAASHGNVQADDFLVDDRAQVAKHLLHHDGTVHLVTDNVGAELLLDLALLDFLMRELSVKTRLHVKLHPTFVSDATAADVRWLIAHLQSGGQGERAAQLGHRLAAALTTGQLQLAPDGYWNLPRLLWDLPPRLTETFTGARLVIIKGDANYRRLSGDAVWPPETPFAEMMAYFPAPVVALRSLKSDTIAGLAPGLAERLDAADPQWRTNGRRGVVQARLGE